MTPFDEPHGRGLPYLDRSLAMKPLDSAWTVLLIDPLGLPVLGLLARQRWVTPMRLTFTAQALGLAAVAAFASGALVMGALLFELRFFFDCMDGKLARLRNETSRLGATLDANADKVVVLACYVALAWAIDAPWLAVAIAVAYLLHFTMADQRTAALGQLGQRKPVESLSLWGIGEWLRRRRIYPTVTTIEVEHGALFVVPLLAPIGIDMGALALVGSVVYFGLQGTRFAASALRAASRLDHQARSRASGG